MDPRHATFSPVRWLWRNSAAKATGGGGGGGGRVAVRPASLELREPYFLHRALSAPKFCSWNGKASRSDDRRTARKASRSGLTGLHRRERSARS